MATTSHDAAVSHPWIDGKPYDAKGDRIEDLLSPWDGSLVARVAMADEATIDAAVASSRAAFLANRRTAPAQRAVWLKAAGAEIDKIKDQIAHITMRALGKPKRACGVEVGRVSQLMQLCAEELLRMEGEVLPLDALAMGAGRFGFTRPGTPGTGVPRRRRPASWSRFPGDRCPHGRTPTGPPRCARPAP